MVDEIVHNDVARPDLAQFLAADIVKWIVVLVWNDNQVIGLDIVSDIRIQLEEVIGRN